MKQPFSEVLQLKRPTPAVQERRSIPSARFREWVRQFRGLGRKRGVSALARAVGIQRFTLHYYLRGQRAPQLWVARKMILESMKLENRPQDGRPITYEDIYGLVTPESSELRN